MSGEHLLAERRRILAAALPLVPFDGWTGKLLTEAAVIAGLEPSVALRAFPGGVVDLAVFHIQEADRLMLEELALRDLPSLKIRDRIATAIQVRLEQQAGNREAIRRAVALLALPGHAPLALRSLYRTVDAIWHAAGDTATDFNFYSKRLLLAGVYSATLLYWLEDKSEAHQRTWAFLDRRIGEIMRLQKFRGRLDRLAADLPARFRRLRGKA